MKKSLIEKYITIKRFESYENIDEYKKNLIFSKEAYIPLSILEVALRNSIDRTFSQNVDTHWYINRDFLTNDSIKKVNQVIELLKKRREPISKDKIIAELSFGFWVNLFKRPYSNQLRLRELKKIFPNLPNKKVKFLNRDIIYKKLNHIRNFRNRIFHYEKVLNKDNYNNIYSEIYEILGYFDNEIFLFTKRLNSERK